MEYTITEASKELQSMNITGNVIMPAWYKTITRENGKAHANAILLLADIVYWYRPAEVRDENTGFLLGYKSRIRGNSLQRSYAQIGEMLGLTKSESRSALDTLRRIGVVSTYTETVTVKNMKLPNCMFIDLHVNVLKSISHVANEPCATDSTPSVIDSTPSDPSDTPSYCQSQTITENTTKISCSNSSSKPTDSTQNVFALFQDNGFGLLSPTIADMITGMESDYGSKWVEEAMIIAIKANSRNIRYVEGILKQWKAKGKSDKPQSKDNNHGKISGPDNTPQKYAGKKVDLAAIRAAQKKRGSKSPATEARKAA